MQLLKVKKKNNYLKFFMHSKDEEIIFNMKQGKKTSVFLKNIFFLYTENKIKSQSVKMNLSKKKKKR